MPRTLALVTLALALASPAIADDPPKKAPAPLDQAAQRMTVPPGFHVQLFAGEPDLRQPIAFTFDDRGRLWVAECYSYPVWLTPGEPKKDRVLIFEDTDGDGKFDSRKVFLEDGANLTGIELGFGGVWLCSTPNLLFVPDRDGDDRPDGPAEVVLDGWSTKAQHNMFNDLIWAPDGWLWGCNGITDTSYVGKPGTPKEKREAINCGVWRYHPTRKVFETVANGTTNPWGLDFDDSGEAFITNCVIPHVYRVLHGAHFERMFGQDFNPNLYGLMPTCADHLHWAGGEWTTSRGGKGKHGEAGGGHAHVGAMIYLGDSWPDKYRDTLFTCNLHGNRVNNDVLKKEGSGYVASHWPDFLMANDEWFRGIALKYGPDGSTFLIDWSDTDECHDTDSNGPERHTGRLYKITYETPKPWSGDLSRLSDLELVKLQLHKNDWFVRHARRILQERAVDGKDLGEAKKALGEILEKSPETSRRLRALWALNAVGGLDGSTLFGLIRDDRDELVRAWALRLFVQEGFVSGENLKADAKASLNSLAERENSPRVRLEFLSASQRIGRTISAAESSLLANLAARPNDQADPNVALMSWYAIEPFVSSGNPAAVSRLLKNPIPLVRKNGGRRLAEVADERPDAREGLSELVAALEASDDSAFRLDVLAGIGEALKGRKTARKPDRWDAAYPALIASDNPEIRESAMLVALVYNDPRAIEDFRKIVADPKAETPRRVRAIEALVDHRTPGLGAELRGLLDQDAVRGAALRGLAAFEDPATNWAILSRYKTFSDDQKNDALATLAARPSSAMALLDAIASGAIPRRDLSVALARQIGAIRSPKLSEKLESAWGSVKPASKEKAAALSRFKAELGPDALKKADPSRGRAVFAKTCASCHRLFAEGGDVGPELTGSDRKNLDYVLENVLDPSATVAKDYRLTNFAMKDGRLISGIIREQSPRAMTVQTANERLTIARDDIEETRLTDVSMMPEGLFEKLSEEEIRDLVAYLASPTQVPAPPR